MPDPIVRIRNLEHTYLRGTPLATTALYDASLLVYPGTITALVGPNGAGKSTLLHFINALVRPLGASHVEVFGGDTFASSLDVGQLRRRVGLVLQYPHQQLFERFVGDDVAYGPRQEGLHGEALRERVHEAMRFVGLEPQAFVDRYTFSLSGGEMRRVALAGVLAMQPELLILDEVTTGLDPRGRKQVHILLRQLKEQGTTVLFTSNDMDEVLAIADRVVVLHRGVTVAEGKPLDLFVSKNLNKWGLMPPAISQICSELRQAGVIIDDDVSNLPELEEVLWQAWKV
jgi:energy-coupling factor transporter ATP-binding protein EcfA2